MSDHNKYLHKFKDAGIWCHWYNTPRVCCGLAEDFSFLSRPVYQYQHEHQHEHEHDFEGRLCCHNNCCDISHVDIYNGYRFQCPKNTKLY